MTIKRFYLFVVTMFYQLAVYASYLPPKPKTIGTNVMVTTKKTESIGDVASNIFEFGQDLEKVVKAISIVSGISIMFIGIVQYGRYRKNPVETPLSKVIMTIFVGLCLIGISFIPMDF